MEFEEVLAEGRWRLLESLARSEKAASEIAAETGMSVANVTQQAKLLAAYGVIAPVERKRGKSPGKPKKSFAIAKEQTFVALIGPGVARKRSFKPDEYDQVTLRTLLLEPNEDRIYLRKFMILSEDLMRELTSLAVVDSNSKEIHLLVVAEPEKLEDLRKRFSKTMIKNPVGTKEKAVIAWTHSIDELREGKGAHDQYYAKLLTKPQILLDRGNALQSVLAEQEPRRRRDHS